MDAIIISIGNELLNGQTLNSNASYISGQLHTIGIPVKRIITIGDLADEIKQSLGEALTQSDIVILTGGLGPTHDDITRTVLTEYFDDELVFNEKLYRKMKTKFKKRGLEMPPVNRNQAMIPGKARLIENPIGTAEGLMFEDEGKYVFSLPGIPREMKEMVKQSIIPFLKERSNSDPIQVHFYRTSGIAESKIYEMCQDLFKSYDSLEIAFLPRFTGVDVRISVIGPMTQPEFENFEEKLYQKIGKYIYVKGHKEIEEVIGDTLRKKGLTLAIAESCTGGLIQDRITNVPGSSDYFLGGITAYSNQSKQILLKVRESTLAQHGAVSEAVAKEMADGARALFNADIAVSTTGIAGPGGATESKPVGLVYTGLATHEKTIVKKFVFGEERRINKERSAQAALELLRRYLLNIEIVAR